MKDVLAKLNIGTVLTIVGLFAAAGYGAQFFRFATEGKVQASVAYSKIEYPPAVVSAAKDTVAMRTSIEYANKQFSHELDMLRMRIESEVYSAFNDAFDQLAERKSADKILLGANEAIKDGVRTQIDVLRRKPSPILAEQDVARFVDAAGKLNPDLWPRAYAEAQVSNTNKVPTANAKLKLPDIDSAQISRRQGDDLQQVPIVKGGMIDIGSIDQSEELTVTGWARSAGAVRNTEPWRMDEIKLTHYANEQFGGSGSVTVRKLDLVPWWILYPGYFALAWPVMWLLGHALEKWLLGKDKARFNAAVEAHEAYFSEWERDLRQREDALRSQTQSETQLACAPKEPAA
jgi:hypothetical protein